MNAEINVLKVLPGNEKLFQKSPIIALQYSFPVSLLFLGKFFFVNLIGHI